MDHVRRSVLGASCDLEALAIGREAPIQPFRTSAPACRRSPTEATRGGDGDRQMIDLSDPAPRPMSRTGYVTEQTGARTGQRPMGHCDWTLGNGADYPGQDTPVNSEACCTLHRSINPTHPYRLRPSNFLATTFLSACHITPCLPRVAR